VCWQAVEGVGGTSGRGRMPIRSDVRHAVGMAEPRTEHTVEWVRESVTMALYMSLSLLAVLVALPSGSTAEAEHFAWTVLLTAIGLLLAHHVAFRLSSRMVNQGLLDEESRSLIGAQTAGGLAVAFVAAVPVWVFGASGVRVSEILLVAFVSATGYRAVRGAPASRTRALLYTGVLVAVIIGVVSLKVVVGH